MGPYNGPKSARKQEAKRGHVNICNRVFWRIDKGEHLVFPIDKFRWIPLSGFTGEDENVSANQLPGRPSCFFRSGRKTHLVEDVEILLPVKFSWIPFSGSIGEVQHFSANQRPGRPFCFSDQPEKHQLGRERWDLAYFLSSFVEFRSKETLLQIAQTIKSQGRHLWSAWSSYPGQKTLRTCFHSLTSFVKFCSAVAEESETFQSIRGHGGLFFVNKYEKFTTDEWLRDRLMVGERTRHDHNSALDPSAQVHLNTYQMKW